MSASKKSKGARRHWPPRIPGAREALKMLTLRPVFATPVPRHHVEPRGPDGSRLVHDRATNERFVVYSPRLVHEFRAGHRAGLWYLRPIAELDTTPRSAGYPSAHAAVEALRAGTWRACRSRRQPVGKPCRVIWP
jgi:hypothetical protein